MILQNRHLEKALHELESAYASVPGDPHESEDLDATLAIIDRALAKALRTSVELLPLVDPTDIVELADDLKAQVGRILVLRALVLRELGQDDFAIHAARLALQALRDTVTHRFADEGRYAANHLHQLLTRPIADQAFRPREAAACYETLFEHYRTREIYDRAEDCLFHALDLSDRPGPLLAQGLTFYDELLALSTVALQRHGLPRHEVNQSRQELVQRQLDLQAPD